MARAIQYTVFDKLLADAQRKGIYRQEAEKASKWFRDKASNVATTFKAIEKDSERAASDVVYGKMFTFQYSAKHKKTLPYWDKFPLIFPIGPAKGGFYGLNFHYLPPTYRAKLLDALYGIARDERFTDNQKLSISYSILNKAKDYAYFKPCLKHYLDDHVMSSFVSIDSTEWDIAIMLPTARFQKAGEEEVWADSLRGGRAQERTFKAARAKRPKGKTVRKSSKPPKRQR